MLIELTTRYLFTNVRIIIHKLRKDLPKGKKKKKKKEGGHGNAHGLTWTWPSDPK